MESLGPLHSLSLVASADDGERAWVFSYEVVRLFTFRGKSPPQPAGASIWENLEILSNALPALYLFYSLLHMKGHDFHSLTRDAYFLMNIWFLYISWGKFEKVDRSPNPSRVLECRDSMENRQYTFVFLWLQWRAHVHRTPEFVTCAQFFSAATLGRIVILGSVLLSRSSVPVFWGLILVVTLLIASW